MFHFYSVFRYQTVQFPAFSSYIIRSYIEFHILSLFVDVSVTTVHDEINWCIPIMWEHFHALVQWPSLEEWNSTIGNWNKTTCISIQRKLTSSGGTRISAGKALRTTLLLSSAIVSCKIQKHWSSLT
jgi:hypothetical protein